MKKLLTLWGLSGCLLVVAQNAGDEARLLRFPSTNGKEIVFSYAGDLYKVAIGGGDAVRLTSFVGYEMFARFSPDGKAIAFTGDYDGSTEVYTIPSDGGEPLRLTYTATNARDDLGDRMGPNNIVMGWTRDGKQIIYRNRISSSFDGRLFLVDRDGGLSKQLPLPEGGFCSYSPDGKKLAYNRVFREFRTWKYYKGGMADDIWVYDEQKKSVENITNNIAQDIQPMWIGNEIYFISDRDRTMNIFVYNTQTKQTAKVTNFTDYDVKFPSSNGSLIVFEKGGYLYTLDPATKQTAKVSVRLKSDNIYARSEQKDGHSYITASSLSPDGTRLAVTARGEVFNVPAEKGVVKNITRSPGSHERGAAWSPNGRQIAYIADGTGETELHVQSAEGGEAVQLTKNNDTYIRTFTWSPDSKSLVYTDRKNRIVLVDVASKAKTTLLEEPAGEPKSVSFSPDSRWLTYTKIADNEYSVVYVYNIAERREYAVTDSWYESYTPAFSTDGKYLMFSSWREFRPVYGSLEWNHIYNSTTEAFLVLLQKDMPSPFLQKDGEAQSARPAAAPAPTAPTAPKSDDKGKAAAKPEVKKEEMTVRIDFDGLADRIVKLPTASGRYGNFYSDGKKVYYTRNGSTYAYELAAQKETQLVEGASMVVEAGRKKALFMRGPGRLFVANIPAGKTELREGVDVSNLVITTDYPQEWAQIFDEAWRAFRDGFYVETMHGVDWKAVKAKYATLLPYVKTRLDLNYVIGEMISELGVGHAYITAGEMPRAKRIKLGLLGAEVSRDKSGFFRIEKILPGVSWDASLRSPLTEPGIKAKAGDYIVAIDGVPTSSVKDMYALLVGKADVPTELSLNSSASLGGARKIVIRPIASEYPLIHHQWVQDNIEKVSKATGGRVGYIYIPDMGPEGLTEFAKYFYPQLRKEGLIIDDRANGGGNISPMLLERLAREPYRLKMQRGSSLTGTIPDAMQVGPKVCLINKYSASDGDLFPWGFRALGIGKLIGTRTWGGIIGITGSLPFVDGTDLRVPFSTSYDPKTGDWIIENHGVDPDILIDNNPIREWQGEDEQLDRAIEEVMKELKDRKPLPGIPSPRVWNK